mmetsp:Transcript_47863/g.124223  ORF Transcript_47863/g.124223 Transcript_47863/m.124223 type:complete len:261 (+) Transcript_47863:1290-2072(+)
MTEMTAALLKQVCKTLKLYSTPELNDKIYLHYKGFSRIGEAISAYTGLRALWLEGNGIDTIENLDCLKELRCLYLQQNLIEDIEGLEENTELDTINLSNNQIAKVSGLSHLKKLSTLHLTHNKLTTAKDIEHLAECNSVTVVDLGNNRLDDPEIVEVFERMGNLRGRFLIFCKMKVCIWVRPVAAMLDHARITFFHVSANKYFSVFASSFLSFSVLNLMGNPVVRKIENYRRTLISRLPSLTYLDDRPVFEEDRRAIEAW